MVMPALFHVKGFYEEQINVSIYEKESQTKW